MYKRVFVYYELKVYIGTSVILTNIKVKQQRTHLLKT